MNRINYINTVISIIYIFILSGCNSSMINFEILEAAEITLPSHVNKILVVNRFRPTRENRFGNIFEGFLTGEKPMQDRAGADQALRSFQQRITESPRFTVIFAAEQLLGTGTGWFPEPLEDHIIMDLCTKYGTDALVCLEAFDSDRRLSGSYENRSRTEKGRTINYSVYVARKDVSITVGWRLYDGKDARKLDEFRKNENKTFTREDQNSQNAVNSLPSENNMIDQLASSVGFYYANRIAPNWVTVRRTIYTGGDPALKEAKLYMETREYDKALPIYKSLLSHPKKSVSGKAAYNMAVAYEGKNDLTTAREWAGKAYTEYKFSKSFNYMKLLEKRLEQDQLLQQQMKTK